MGCWNGTCFLSNLAIMCSDPVVAILIARKPRPNDRLTSISFEYDPVFVPIFGSYNDYGSIEDIEESARTAHLLKWVNNPKHHKVVSRKFDQEHHPDEHPPFEDVHDFFKSVERGYVNLVLKGLFERKIEKGQDGYNEEDEDANTHFYMDETALDTHFVMIHRSVYEAFVNAGSIAELRADLEDKNKRWHKRVGLNFNSLIELSHNEGEYWHDLGYKNVDAALEVLALKKTLDSLRKAWAPSVGAGSQDYNADDINRLHKATKQVIAKHQKDFEE